MVDKLSDAAYLQNTLTNPRKGGERNSTHLIALREDDKLPFLLPSFVTYQRYLAHQTALTAAPNNCMLYGKPLQIQKSKCLKGYPHDEDLHLRFFITSGLGGHGILSVRNSAGILTSELPSALALNSTESIKIRNWDIYLNYAVFHVRNS